MKDCKSTAFADSERRREAFVTLPLTTQKPVARIGLGSMLCEFHQPGPMWPSIDLQAVCFEPSAWMRPADGSISILEILSLHEKIDELREMKWAELITMQHEQIRLLTQLMKEHLAASR